MIKIYLLVNAFLYLLFSVMCLVNPTGTANTLGYGFLNNSGKVEYLVLYTGLELGFAMFFAISAFYPQFQLGGLLFAVCTFVCIMLVRGIGAVACSPVLKVTYLVGALEYALGIWGLVLLYNALKNS